MARDNTARRLHEQEENWWAYEQPVEETPRPRLTVRASAPKVSRMRIALCMGLLLSLVVMTIQSSVARTVQGDLLVQYQRQLSALQQEEERLQSRLDHEVPMLNLKAYASDTLGMSKVREYQTVYLNLEEENTVVRTEKCPDRDLLHRLLKKAGEWLEYLKAW